LREASIPSRHSYQKKHPVPGRERGENIFITTKSIKLKQKPQPIKTKAKPISKIPHPEKNITPLRGKTRAV
jgi:hypothetical protein